MKATGKVCTLKAAPSAIHHPRPLPRLLRLPTPGFGNG